MGQTVVKTGAQALSGSTLVYSSAVAGVYSALIDFNTNVSRHKTPCYKHWQHNNSCFWYKSCNK